MSNLRFIVLDEGGDVINTDEEGFKVTRVSASWHVSSALKSKKAGLYVSADLPDFVVSSDFA